MSKKPFIHLFSTTTGYYFFDVNTDTIVSVSQEVYQKLKENCFDDSDEYIRKI